MHPKKSLAALTIPRGPRITGRLVLLATSPRVPAGLLCEPAWSVLRAAGSVRSGAGHSMLAPCAAAGIAVLVDDDSHPAALAARLARVAETELVVWLVGADGEEHLRRELEAHGVVAETLVGSYDLPGARLLDLVATMDRLRSPGGCPWDAEQTHESLTTYLLEETYETLEAIESGDRTHLREELGDLLLQVVFHARIAQDDPEAQWSVDEVADDIVAKLVRRHPHVFGPRPGHLRSAAEVEASWHESKAAEKRRTSAVDGVPTTLPALALASALMQRARAHQVEVAITDDDGVGSALMTIVADAARAGLDAETELRAAARRYADRVRAADAASPTKEA